MSNQPQFQAVFKRLREILHPFAGRLDCVRDDPDDYYLNTKHIMKNKKPLFFGAVQIGKAYVSFHLMPVYVNPELLDNLSPELRKRMQGKSCFNFKIADQQLFDELAQLTAAGFRDYVDAGYI